MFRSAALVLTRWFLKLFFFFGLFAVSIFFSVFFGIVTFFLSLLIFSRLEHDKKTHERTFYLIEEPTKIFSAFLNLSSKLDVLGKSLIFGVLTAILFSGTNYERILQVSFLFLVMIWLGALFLNILEKQNKVHVERWGYVRISLILGVSFSILISSISGIGLFDIAKTIAKNELTGEIDFNQAAELIYGLLYQLDAILENIFINIFGEFFGGLVALLLTVNIAYGFVIYIYVIQYHRLKKRYSLWAENKKRKWAQEVSAAPNSH